MLQPRVEPLNREPIFTINQHYKHLMKSFHNGKVDGAEMDRFH